MTSEIDKLKHFYIEDYSGIYFTDELNNGEEFLYTTIGIKDDKEVTFLCKYVKNKHIEACPSSINKTTMKNILNDGRDISIAKLVENTSLIIK